MSEVPQNLFPGPTKIVRKSSENSLRKWVDSRLGAAHTTLLGSQAAGQNEMTLRTTVSGFMLSAVERNILKRLVTFGGRHVTLTLTDGSKVSGSIEGITNGMLDLRETHPWIDTDIDTRNIVSIRTTSSKVCHICNG